MRDFSVFMDTVMNLFTNFKMQTGSFIVRSAEDLMIIAITLVGGVVGEHLYTDFGANHTDDYIKMSNIQGENK